MLALEKKPPNFQEGAYGVVFFTTDGSAIKVFRRRRDATEEHVKSVFRSECHAYQLAMNHHTLCGLVPAFEGQVNVSKVTDADGSDISNQFYLYLAYQMKKIDGDFVKLGTLPREIQKSIAVGFCSAGINHTCDASVIYDGNKITCVIDFAMQEFVIDHTPPPLTLG